MRMGCDDNLSAMGTEAGPRLGRRLLGVGAALLLVLIALPATAHAADRIYWSNFETDSIVWADLDGGGGGGTVDTTGATVDGPMGLAVDPARGLIYWANWGGDTGTTISYARLDGTGGGDLAITGATIDAPHGLAIDPTAGPYGTLYWPNHAANSISWAELDGAGGGAGGDFTIASATVDEPRGMMIDPLTDRLYWSNFADAAGTAISYVDLDGTGDGDLIDISPLGAGPEGTAIDPATRKIYWSDFGQKHLIQFANLDGTGVATLNTTGARTRGVHGVAIDPDTQRIYWPNWYSDGIAYARLDGSGGANLDTSGTPVSRPNLPVILKRPAATAAPAITGGAEPGSTLRCTPASWAGDAIEALAYRAPESISYRWTRDGADLPGASADTITADTAGTYRCHVTATNAAGSTTQDSAGHPVAPPRPAPILTATNPASPATAASPRVKGTSPASGTGSLIKIYVNDPTCSGTPAASSNVATFQGKGVRVGPLAVGTSELRATFTDPAGNVTACSAPLDYTRLGTPAPTITATNPASPATADNPRVKGTSPAAGTGYRIKLYVNDPTCSGPPAADSNVAAFQGKGVRIGPLAVGTSEIRATLTTPAGDASPCSAPISYTRL